MTQPRMVGGRYELGELIGYGGMAEVHRGYDSRLNREVAIKVLRADLARDPSFLNRFRREAHSAAGLNHPAIVSVYDTGEDNAPDGTAIPFIVMEYVQGRTLRDILKSEGRLPGRRAMEITADVCNALDFSHRNGIIHRDIKPANVMITPSGAVKVMDFGIARAVADSSATQTQTANVIGTAQYLSPEQARGESVDARSDVYSTGCLLYELVTGVPPFQGDSPVAVAYQHVRENPVLPSARNPDVPRAVDSVVMKALAKNQLNRYQSAGEMRADIQRALANQPVVAEAVMTDAERTQFIARTPPPMPVAGQHRTIYEVEDERDTGRRSGLIWALVVLALLLVIGIGGYLLTKLGTGGTKKPAQAVVPATLIGETTQAAEQKLAALGLNPQKGEPTSGDCDGPAKVDPGKVCTVSPGIGTKVDKDTTVTYHVYAKQLVPVPPVEEKQYTDAQTILNKAGLKWKKHSVHNQAPLGTVIHQSPQAYTSEPVGYKVVLDVSTGTIKLPDVVGKALDEARLTLGGAHFSNVVVDTTPVITDNPDKDNTVKDENPQGGHYWKPDVKVTLTVYKYQEPQTSCPPSPSGLPSLPSGITLPPSKTPPAPPPSGSGAPSGKPSC